MSAREALGRQWFHGSPHLFNEGDTILPPSKTGADTHRSDSHRGRTFMTDTAYVAQKYAGGAHGMSHEGHVYEVEPVGKHHPDPAAPTPMDRETNRYTTKGLRVVRRLEKWELR